MTTVISDIKLRFPFDTEFSIDGKVTWTALAANTDHTVLAASLDDDLKVYIRSQDANATTLAGMDLALDTTIFETIKITNATNLTTMASAFKDSTITNLEIYNAPLVEDINQLCYNAAVNQIKIGQLPALTNMTSAFSLGNYGRIAQLRVGSNAAELAASSTFRQSKINVFEGMLSDALMSAFSYAFYQADMGSMGHIDILSKGGSAYAHVFDRTYIDYFPSYDFKLQEGTNYSFDTFMDYMYSYIAKNYFPTQMNRVIDNSSQRLQFNNSFAQIAFGDIRIDALKASDSDVYVNSSSAPSPTMRKVIGQVNAPLNWTAEPPFKDALGIDSSKRFFYEKPEIVPNVHALAVLINTELIGAKTIGCYARQNIKATKAGTEFTLIKDTGYATLRKARFTDTVKTYTADYLALGRTGHAALMTANVSVEDVDGVVVDTINDAFQSGMFNSNSTELYLVKDGVYTSNGATQTLTPTVVVRTLATASSVTFTPTIPAETALVAVYRHDAKYGVKAVFNEYNVNGDFVRAYVKSYTDFDFANELGVTEDITFEVTAVGQDYFETAELNLVNEVDGSYCRVVGK